MPWIGTLLQQGRGYLEHWKSQLWPLPQRNFEGHQINFVLRSFSDRKSDGHSSPPVLGMRTCKICLTPANSSCLPTDVTQIPALLLQPPCCGLAVPLRLQLRCAPVRARVSAYVYTICMHAHSLVPPSQQYVPEHYTFLHITNCVPEA